MPGKKRKHQDLWFVETIVKAERLQKPEILGCHTTPGEGWQYEVKWAGFPSSENTWETTLSLWDCKPLLSSFWNHVGHENYLINVPKFPVTPSKAWIKHQKLAFAKDVPLEVVEAQNRDPKRARKDIRLPPRTPPKPKPSGSRRSPRKVSFASVAAVHTVPTLDEVENTAQWMSVEHSLVKLYDGLEDGQDSWDEQESLADATPARSGRKRPTPGPSGLGARNEDAGTSSERDPLSLPVPESEAASRSASAAAAAAKLPTPSPTPPRTIRIWDEAPLKEPKNLYNPIPTKKKLGRAQIAVGVERAEKNTRSRKEQQTVQEKEQDQPAQSAPLENDNNHGEDDEPEHDHDENTGPTFFLDEGCDDGPEGGSGIETMLSNLAVDKDADEPLGSSRGGNGLFDKGEGTYAGLRKNGDIEVGSATTIQDSTITDIIGASFDMEIQCLNESVLGLRVNGSDSIMVDFLNPVDDHGLPYFPDSPGPKHTSPADENEHSPAVSSPNIAQWSWSGSLCILGAHGLDVVCQKATLVGSTYVDADQIPLHDFHSIVSSLPEICLNKFYDVEDAEAFLAERASTSPNQIAKLRAGDSLDEERFGVLVEYMRRKEQVACVRCYHQKCEIGIAMFIPSTAESLLKQLPGAAELSSSSSLPSSLVVVLLLNPSSSKLSKCRIILPFARKTVTRALDNLGLSGEAGRESLRTERAYRVALRILKLPPEIHHLVREHPATVWSGNDLPDTQLLNAILSRFKGVVALEDCAAKIVFVHAGARERIHQLPHLAQRRLCSDVRLFLYSMQLDVHPACRDPPFLEIYPLGGIVTFTANALVEDAWGVLKAIRSVYAQPFKTWDCYILPEVLGLALHQCNASAQQLPLVFDRIFDAILEGKVALMHAPRNTDPSSEEGHSWIRDRSLLHPITKSGIVERCDGAFREVFRFFKQSEWMNRAKDNVREDMCRMQTQEAFLESYRRYVVLDYRAGGEDDAQFADGIEFRTWPNFTFDFEDDTSE